jgi:ADP-heptose:LPS heptosyltransferase
MKAIVRAKTWKENTPPTKILVMRFQALGDTVITLPYLQDLKSQFPNIELHFLTREEVSPIPKSIVLFDKVITIGGGRNAKIQFLLALIKLPWLILQRYDAVLDLQNHKISCIVRKLLFTKAWAEFDRSSPISAGERTRQTIEALWHWKINLNPTFDVRNKECAVELLRKNGWQIKNNLVVLNPAGSFPSRNWPTGFYIEFARLWLKEISINTQFVLLLLPSLAEKANYISQALGPGCIDLTGKADQVEAFCILQHCTFVLSEDGGMMHMAWTQGIPTLAMFSSSKKEWSAPQGKRSACLDSSDLECGPCELFVCKYGDNRCLTRYTPQIVIAKAKELINQVARVV